MRQVLAHWREWRWMALVTAVNFALGAALFPNPYSVVSFIAAGFGVGAMIWQYINARTLEHWHATLDAWAESNKMHAERLGIMSDTVRHATRSEWTR